jgi:RND family efflux transporter MFP subunit
LKVASESIRVAVKATGTAQPIRAANLGPQTTARIEEIMVSEGSVVEKGQGLVRLDVQGARLRAAQAQAAAAAVQAQAQLAEADYQRLAPLAERGTISAQRGTQLKAQRDALASSAKAADAAAAQAKRGITDTTVRAPFAGTVSSVLVEVGEIATMMPPRILVRLVDISELEVRIQVHERELERIANGDEVTVKFPSSGREVVGTVTYIAPEIQPHTRSAEVVTRIANADKRLRAGLFAEIQIAPATSREGIVVPSSALGGTGEARFVYVVVDGQAKRTDVDVRPLGPERVEVLKGLTGGETIVESGLSSVSDGTKIGSAPTPAKSTTKPEGTTASKKAQP